MPWQPAAAKAFRSAWIPAPPPESDVAIVRQRGTNSLPSPVRTGSGSTGVISAPEGTPVRRGYHRRVAVETALWDDLLEGEELAHLTVVPSAEPQTAPLPPELHPKLAAALPFPELYLHQRRAWDAAARGEHVVITTGTASGKSLAFNLPVLDAIAREPKTRALYLYPTKALAQDQARALGELKAPNVRAGIYDGDTPSERRWQIRKWANVILTNPDMLHVGVLPHHDRWADVLHNLRFVVVDEAHVYRGVFGSHVGNVLRRLRRLARVYGADPQFLLATATIANPVELAASLAGVDAVGVDLDAAPRAERTIALWNPELLDVELGLRASALGDASRLMAGLVSRGLRTICFAKSRKAAELIHRFTVQRVDEDTGKRLAPYRAGYTPAQRREIERRLVEGDLLGVSATDALELGIDIGLLDCALSVGFPGTIASLRQQWGRAGRRGHGLAVLVASEDALDQYFMREPETLLGRRVEAAILDHTNPRVLDGHVLAAAFEAPVDDADRETLGDEALERAALLPELKRTKAGYVWAGRDYPAGRVPLRSTSPDSFAVVEAQTGTILGLVERERAYSTVHEGAVYLHLGESYLVHELALTSRTAVVTPYSGDYYTQAKKETTTSIEETLRLGAPLRARPRLRPRLGDGAGRRVQEDVRPRPGDAGDRAARPPRDELRDRGDLVPARAGPARRPVGDAEAARHAARGRALDDRAPAALGDVRPLGHRRPVDERPLPDGPADGVRLRRPPGRRRDHGAGLRLVRGLGRRHCAHARGLPVRRRVPILCPEPEVRQPQRAARQGGCPHVPAPAGGRIYVSELTPRDSVSISALLVRRSLDSDEGRNT